MLCRTASWLFFQDGTFPSLHLRHSSFSNPSAALHTSQLILQSFRCFTYVATRSLTLLSLLLCHRIFTYVTWRAAHGVLLYLNLTYIILGVLLRLKPEKGTFPLLSRWGETILLTPGWDETNISPRSGLFQSEHWNWLYFEFRTVNHTNVSSRSLSRAP